MNIQNLFHFNPTCEIAVANNSNYFQPIAILRQFEKELASLFVFCTNAEDAILVDDLPNEEYLSLLDKIGLRQPNFIRQTDLKNITSVDKIIPWGWSRNEHRIFAPIKNVCSLKFQQSPIFDWQDAHRRLFDRTTAIDILRSIVDCHNKFINPKNVGEVCYNKKQLDEVWKKYTRVVVKTPFSSSGRGVFMMKNAGDFATKISKAFNDFGYVIAEPFFEKIHDFSMQFESVEHCIRFRGFSHFNIEDGGKYTGQLIGNWHFDSQVEQFFSSQLPLEVVEIVRSALQASDYARIYEGWLGVDCMLVREDSVLKIHPMVEINCRNTMGMIAQQIGNLIHQNSRAVFSIQHSPNGFTNDDIAPNLTFADGLIQSGKFVAIPMSQHNNFIAQVFIYSDN